jgi:glycosyltransferase involved in cell wall biosynthesis
MLDPVCLRTKRSAKKAYGWLVDRETIRGASGFHFLSGEEGQRAVVGRAIRPDEAVVSPNGVPETRTTPSRGGLTAAFPDLLGRRVVLHLGRLHPIKGIDVQILALAALPKEERPVLLLVGPDCGVWRQLKRLARREGVEDWVRRGGEVYGEQRFDLLAEADLVILTSIYDCNPVVAVEAMTVGGAMLATEGCGLAEAARQGAAVTVPRNPETIACAMRELLADSDRIAVLRQRARQYVEDRLRWDRVLPPLLQLYDRIAERRNVGMTSAESLRRVR